MKSQTILIIDEEEAVRESLQLVFQEEGFNCIIAENISKAKELLTTEPVSMLIVESSLLVPSSFLSFILSTYPSVIVLVMSSYAEIEVMQRAILNGAHDFVIKPLEFQELIDKVHQHLTPLTN
jgi:DNA-binding NtrC family response regulator